MTLVTKPRRRSGSKELRICPFAHRQEACGGIAEEDERGPGKTIIIAMRSQTELIVFANPQIVAHSSDRPMPRMGDCMTRSPAQLHCRTRYHAVAGSKVR